MSSGDSTLSEVLICFWDTSMLINFLVIVLMCHKGTLPNQ
jgi:hypothetical protein